MGIPHFMFPCISRWTFWFFLFLAIMKNADMNTCVQIFMQMYVFIFLRYGYLVELLGHIVT